MREKGTMTMEPTDVNTGEVETVAEENHIFGLNLLGVFYEMGEGIDGIKWQHEPDGEQGTG